MHHLYDDCGEPQVAWSQGCLPVACRGEGAGFPVLVAGYPLLCCALPLLPSRPAPCPPPCPPPCAEPAPCPPPPCPPPCAEAVCARPAACCNRRRFQRAFAAELCLPCFRKICSVEVRCLGVSSLSAACPAKLSLDYEVTVVYLAADGTRRQVCCRCQACWLGFPSAFAGQKPTVQLLRPRYSRCAGGIVVRGVACIDFC